MLLIISIQKQILGLIAIHRTISYQVHIFLFLSIYPYIQISYSLMLF